jgi:3-mercaptopyruvate sulfurtransferase SseA
MQEMMFLKTLLGELGFKTNKPLTLYEEYQTIQQPRPSWSLKAH